MTKIELEGHLTFVRKCLADGTVQDKNGNAHALDATAKVSLGSLERCISTALKYPEVETQRVLETWDGDVLVGKTPIKVKSVAAPGDVLALVREGFEALKNGCPWHHTGFPEPA